MVLKSVNKTLLSSDYFPFGMRMWNRSINSSEYKYGFNGKEKDDEVKGEGAQYDYGFRIYDPRLGRFLSVDPLTRSYPWYTPYQFAGNKPIWAIDLDGLEEAFVHDTYDEDKQVIIRSIRLNPKGGDPGSMQYENPDDKEPIGEIFEGTDLDKHFINELKTFVKNDPKSVKTLGLIYPVRVVTNDDVNNKTQQESNQLLLNSIPVGGSKSSFIGNIFKGGSDNFLNSDIANKEIAKLAKLLIENPDVDVTIIGHTGSSIATSAEGDATNYNEWTSINGDNAFIEKNSKYYTANLGGLMDLRSDKIKGILENEYGISPDRVKTDRGQNKNNDNNRKTEFKFTNSSDR